MKLQDHRTATWLLWLSFFLAGFSGVGLYAQDGGKSTVFPPTSEDYQVLWRKLDDFRQKGDWDAVLAALREHEQRLENDVASNVVISAGASMSPGVRWLFNSYVRLLPEDKLATWQSFIDEKLAGPWIQSRGDIFSGDRRRLCHRIIRDYQFSSFYGEALMEVIDVAFLSGDWRRGRRRGAEILEAEARGDVPLDDDLILKIYALVLRADSKLGNARSFATLKDRLIVELESRKRSVESLGPTWQELLSSQANQRIESLPAADHPSNSLSASIGTRKANNYRLGGIVWRSQKRDSELRRFLSERAQSSYDSTGDVPLPFHPARSGSLILLQRSDRVACYDVSKRRERWTHLLRKTHSPFNLQKAPIASMTTGYFVHGNTLIALDLETGESEWERSFLYDTETQELIQSSSAQQHAVAKSTVISVYGCDPMTFFGEHLILPVMVRLEREVLCYVLCMTARGEFVWKTFLGSSRTTNYLGLGSVGSPPLSSDGSVFYSSNAGFVAGLDGFDGTIRWIKEYPLLSTRGLKQAIRDENRWHANPIVNLPGEAILVAPQDSQLLLALDKETGATRWELTRERYSTLLGHDGERCFLAGRQVAAVDIRGESAGKVLWTMSLEVEAARPLGRASLLSGNVLVSTHAGLLHIDGKSGKLLAQDLWGFPGGGGNHLLVDGHLAVIHPGGFSIYNDLGSERQRVAGLSEGRPETLLEKAKFDLRTGSIDRGLTKIDRWRESQPRTPDANSPLDRLHLEVAEILDHLADTETGEVRTQLLRARADIELRPSRQVNAAIDLSRHLESIGQFAASIEALHLALGFDTPRTEFTADGTLTLPSAAYIRNQILELRKMAPEASLEPLEQEAATELEKVRSQRSRETKATVVYRELMRKYPYTRAAAAAHKELANAYLDARNYGAAAQILLGYQRDYPGADDVVRVGLRTADLLYNSGDRVEAKRQYVSLMKEHGTEIVTGVRGMSSRETVETYVRRRLADPGLAEVNTSESPELQFPIRMLWRSPADLLAINRTLLVPAGRMPLEFQDCFYTQSNEVLECRNLSDGLPRWTVHLRMIPGFHLDKFASEFFFARSGDRVIKARFIGSTLILFDHRNIFAIDSRGKVRWHVPAGGVNNSEELFSSHRLSERLRGVAVSESGVFATTSRKKIYAYDLNGEKLWERKIDFNAAPLPPLVSDAKHAVFVASAKKASESQRFRGYSIATSEPMGFLQDDVLFEKSVRNLKSEPLVLPNDLILLPYSGDLGCSLELHDMERRRRLWTFEERSTILDIFYSVKFPREVILSINRSNNWHGLVAISLLDGSELWRYENFGARRNRLSVFRDGNRVYVIHGREQWKLLALEISRGANRGKLQVNPFWTPREVSLGTFFNSNRERVLHITSDALIFPDSDSISVFDKETGEELTALRTGAHQFEINRFLVEKGSFTTALLDGRLLILTDGGDCAFGAAAALRGHQATQRILREIHQYFSKPDSVRPIIALALALFRQGTPEGLQSAVNLLDGALLSEKLQLIESASNRQLLSYLMNGFKEEALKRQPRVQIISPKIWSRPKIDGEMEDAWNFAYRLRLASPRYIGRISAAPGRGLDWEGEEDLSAILYTGWDEDYFYFALDVDDDSLRAFDRDADNWRGDCLIIGVDPDGDGGYRQGPSDQLMTLALTIPKRKKRDKDNEDDPLDEEGEGSEDEKDADGKDDDPEDKNQPEGEFSVKKKEDDSGAIYEVALPWSSFRKNLGGIKPRKGMSFGLSLLLIDDDTGSGATKTLSLNSCHLLPSSQKQIWIWKYLIPEYFPRVVLR